MRRGVEALGGVERALVQVSVGQGLGWSVALDPWVALARDEAGLRQRGLMALSLAAALAALTLLASPISAGRTAGRNGGPPGVAARPRAHPAAATAPRAFQDHATAPIDLAPPAADERDIAWHAGQVAQPDTDPARFVEGILDFDYVDPSFFDALAQEFGEEMRSLSMVSSPVLARPGWRTVRIK